MRTSWFSSLVAAFWLVAAAVQAQEQSAPETPTLVPATSVGFDEASFRLGFVFDKSTFDDPEATVVFTVFWGVVVPNTAIDTFVRKNLEGGRNVVVLCRPILQPDGSYDVLRALGRPIGCGQPYR